MSRRPAPLHPVALVDRWDGFCLPCGDDARPLALTWTGSRGLRAWLSGAGWTDGELRLTCTCCGSVDVVGWQDEPEPELVSETVSAVVSATVSAPTVTTAPPSTVVPDAPAVRVVRVLDLDAPAADTVHALAEVPQQRAGTPRGAADDDALDLLHLAS